MDLKSFFLKLTLKLQLGNMISEVVRVSGGFTHRMYRLETDLGVYIVKMLNQSIMKRPTAMDNYSEADRLENIIHENNIPIIPSLVFNGNKMQELGGQYFYVYEWYDGKSLKDNEITKFHCQQVSRALSNIHHIDMKTQKNQRDRVNIDWDYYMGVAKIQNPLIYNLLSNNRALLYENQENGNSAIKDIPNVVAICHNDMDSKNVLWIGNDFRIIDLECLCYSNPYIEMFEQCLSWSGFNSFNMDFELLKTCADTYFEGETHSNIDWETIYYSTYSRLEWLEYNVKRALMIECDDIEEQELGIVQTKVAIKQVVYYNNIKEKILSCLK